MSMWFIIYFSSLGIFWNIFKWIFLSIFWIFHLFHSAFLLDRLPPCLSEAEMDACVGGVYYSMCFIVMFNKSYTVCTQSKNGIWHAKMLYWPVVLFISDSLLPLHVSSRVRLVRRDYIRVVHLDPYENIISNSKNLKTNFVNHCEKWLCIDLSCEF